MEASRLAAAETQGRPKEVAQLGILVEEVDHRLEVARDRVGLLALAGRSCKARP